MRKRTFAFLLILTLLLSSCGDGEDNRFRIAQNGDLSDVAEPAIGTEIDAYVRPIGSELAIALIASYEPFIFYVGSKTCSACLAFRPNVLRYIYETKALVYYLNIDVPEGAADYRDIATAYPQIFKAIRGVPCLMVIKDENTFFQGENSKMTASTYSPFLTMMTAEVRVTKMKSIATYATVESERQTNERNLFFFFNRYHAKSRAIYATKILPAAEESDNSLSVVDVSEFDAEELAQLQSNYSLSTEVGPVAQYYENGLLVDPHLFGIDERSDAAFLDAYL
ncbi:MAG: hypothetical protein WC344_00185 [Bacilli bacterium]|jgi:predicted bacteriocin transport accessory protein